MYKEVSSNTSGCSKVPSVNAVGKRLNNYKSQIQAALEIQNKEDVKLMAREELTKAMASQDLGQRPNWQPDIGDYFRVSQSSSSSVGCQSQDE